jgi:hypothetical protein
MYRLLRNIHLFFGLFSFLSLVMYGVSTVQMAHRTRFPLKPTVSVATVMLPDSDFDGPRALAQELMRRELIGGEITQANSSADGYKIRAMKIAANYDISYSKQTRAASIQTSTLGFMGMLNRLHHAHGVQYESTIRNVWGAFLGFIAFALIVIGTTGIYMWFKLHQERVIGIVLLALSLGYSLTVIVLMRTA